MSRRDLNKNGGQARTGTVALDLAKVELALRRRGLTWTSKKSECDVSRATWYRLKTGKRISSVSANAIAAFLGFDIAELLVSAETGSEAEFAWPEHPEWEIVEGCAPWERTSNGLYFFRCKVKHKHLGDEARPEFGRARVYDLTRVPESQRREMKELLTRHPLVCRQLARFPQFIGNLSVAPVAGETIWWVVDEWIEGRTLTEVMSAGPVPDGRLRILMRRMAEGLGILHSHDIVLRELSPQRVLIDSEEQVRFAELDLAKLLFGTKTVAAEWPLDPYRAPEVEGGSATPQADYFSWAMVYLHAATGNAALVASEVDAVDSIRLSVKLKGVLKSCLSSMHSKRPRSAKELIAALK